MPSANDLNRLFSLVVDMLCIAGHDGYFKQLSPAWERTLGYTEAELLAKPYLEFIHPDDRQPTIAAAERLSAGMKVMEFRNRYLAKDGTYRWLWWNAAPFTEEGLVYAVARDITDHKRLEDRRAAAYAVTRVLATALTLDAAAPEIIRVVCEGLDWDAGAIWHVDTETDIIRCVQLWHVPSVEIPRFSAITKEAEFPPGVGLPGRVWKTDQPHWLPDVVEDPNFPRAQVASQEGLHGAFGFPIRVGTGVIGVIEFFSHEIREPDRNILELFDAIGSQIGQFTERLKAEGELLETQRQKKQIEEQKNRLKQEKLYLEEEIRNEYFGDIVGESAPLRQVLEQIETVAKTSATVLILGETGTGKELIARALHNQSDRKAKTFVKLNCSAIPTGLLESELFGHEKGAFTGAIAQKLGRLELADKGTLFLDEIGDIPLELQPKLLRALQEHEFERLGSTRTQRVDFRLIAATNRDLSQMVADRQFRSDLFYRLNVFPIHVPPLRERVGDIPRLVRHFASKYSDRMNKRIETIPAETMRALSRWNWPGNIRELENFIERAVILTHDSTLNVPISELQIATAPAAKAAAASAATSSTSQPPLTLEEKEREHILKILRETNGTLSGPNGAASRLGVKRTTLQAKMKKLGIGRDSL
jgi:formate hydrogenlyase transcriptional activator